MNIFITIITFYKKIILEHNCILKSIRIYFLVIYQTIILFSISIFSKSRAYWKRPRSKLKLNARRERLWESWGVCTVWRVRVLRSEEWSWSTTKHDWLTADWIKVPVFGRSTVFSLNIYGSTVPQTPNIIQAVQLTFSEMYYILYSIIDIYIYVCIL